MYKQMVMIENLLVTKSYHRCLNYVLDCDLSKTYKQGMESFLRHKLFHEIALPILENPYLDFLLQNERLTDFSQTLKNLLVLDDGMHHVYVGRLLYNQTKANADDALVHFDQAIALGLVHARSYVAEIYIFQKKYQAAIPLLEVSQDCPLSLLYLAHCYVHGFGVETNFVKAVYYYQQAIELDYDEAYFALATILMDSDQTKYGPRYCFDLIEKAAKKGHTQALLYMIRHYSKLDKDAYLDWLAKAAIHGDSDMKYALGYDYYYGLNLPKDCNQAKYWLYMAVDAGHALAVEKVNEFFNEVDKRRTK